MSGRASPRAIGAFVVAGIVLAVASVAVFGSGRMFDRTFEFVSFFDANVSGLGPGSRVKFRGVDVGSVEGVYLGLAEVTLEPGETSIPVIFRLNESLVAGRGATIDLSDPRTLDSMINVRSMAATLATESLVTGRQFVQLDFFPDRERRFVGVEGTGLFEVPTVQTGFEEVSAQLQDLVADVSNLDLQLLFEDLRGILASVREQVEGGDLTGIGDRLTGALEGLDRTLIEVRGLVASADSVLPSLSESVDRSVDVLRDAANQFEGTLGMVQELAEPDGRLLYQLDTVLGDLGAAARSFRDLADYLERNPSALVRGRPDNEEPDR